MSIDYVMEEMHEPGSIEADVLEHFEMLMRHAAGAHAPEFLGVDLTMPQAKLLYLVSLRPDQPMSALVPQLGVGLPAVSGLVDRLALLGYLERREDPVDRRYQLLNVTERGAAALDRMRELNAEAMRRLLAGLAPHELEALNTSLIALDREVQRLYRAPDPVFTNHDSERTPA